MPVWILLGRMARERGLLTEAQLQHALRIQEQGRPAPPLGVILVEEGFLTHEQVVDLLSAQGHALATPDREADETRRSWRFGVVAVRRRAASPEQLNAALREQVRRADLGEPWKPLGEILVEQGVLTPGQVRELLAGRDARSSDPDAPTLLDAPPTPDGRRPGAGEEGANRTRTGRFPPSGTDAVAEFEAAAPVRAGAPPPATSPGTRGSFGKYELMEELGRGGMGVVYRAYDRELRREIALKTLSSMDLGDADRVQRLLHEARTAGALDHPSIVPIHDVGMHDGMPYFAMAYVRGQTLAQALKLDRLPGRRRRVEVVCTAAEAVAHAHARLVVHRDLKPGNLLIDDTEAVRVMDFGLARRLDEASGLTRSGEVLGTPAYMAPEQIDADVGPIGPATDVYALGAILYEMLTGEPPFARASLGEIFHQVLSRDPRPPREKDRRIPVDLETVCLKALAKRPGERYPSAREFAAELRRYLEGEAVEARPEGLARRTWRKAMRHKGWTALAGVAGIAVCVALAAGARAARLDRARAAAEVERAHLHAELLSALRSVSRTNLKATLLLRRRGEPTAVTQKEFLPALEDAARRVSVQAPGLAEPHYHLGRMYRALLRFEDARREQERALERDPDFAPARYERVVLGAREYLDRLAEQRSAWWRSEGARLAASGALRQGGLGGQAMRSLPSDAELMAGPLRAIAAELATDVGKLEHSGGSADAGADLPRITPTMMQCARALRRLLAPDGKEKDHPEARALLEQAHAEDPALEEAATALAAVLSWSGRREEAAAVLTRAIAADAGYVPHRLQRARLRFEIAHASDRRGGAAERGYREVIDDFSGVLGLDPDCLAAWLGRGQARLNLGSVLADSGVDPAALHDEAIADFDRAIALAPGSAEAWKARGAARMNVGYERQQRGREPDPLYASAIEDFGRAIAADAGDAAPWLLRGLTRVNWGLRRAQRGEEIEATFAEAVADFDQALQRMPAAAETWGDRGQARNNWATLRMARGQDPFPLLEAALADFDKAIELDPGDAMGWVRRASARVNLGNARADRGEDARRLFDAAIADFAVALERNPAEIEAWIGRAGALAAQGVEAMQRGEDPAPRLTAAIEDLSRALAINPRAAAAWMHRGGLRTNLAESRRGLARDPEERARLFQAAVADFDQAIGLQPVLGDAWRSRGLCRRLAASDAVASGRDPEPLFTDAIADLRKATGLNPVDGEAWMLEGLTALEWGVARSSGRRDGRPQFEAAIAAFDKRLELAPNDVRARLRRGEAAYRGGRFAEAVADFETGIRLEAAARDRVLGMLEDARWRASLARADHAIHAGDYAAAGREYENGLAEHARWASLLTPPDQARVRADPAMRAALALVCYNLACTEAVRSTGRSGPGAVPQSIAPEEAARWRERAFQHLSESLEHGGPAQVQPQQDPDLEPLRSDPRWAEIRDRLEGREK